MLSAYLIRHGESTANAGLATEHPLTIELTSKGLQQAQALAEALALTPQQIIHSPYLRTRQTALPLIARHPQIPVLEMPVQEFTYLNPEAWRGTTAEQRWPAVEAFWQRADPDWRDDGEGTENFRGLLHRAEQLLQWLGQQEPQALCIFSHGIFICAVLWLQRLGSVAMAAGRMAEFRVFQQALAPLNVSVTRITWPPEPPLRISPTLVALGHNMPPLP